MCKVLRSVGHAVVNSIVGLLPFESFRSHNAKLRQRSVLVGLSGEGPRAVLQTGEIEG